MVESAAKTRWSARNRYEPEARPEARFWSEFKLLKAIEKECPEVLQALREELLPLALRCESTRLWEVRDDDEWETAEELEFARRLRCWALRFNLVAPFVEGAARATLSLWLRFTESPSELDEDLVATVHSTWRGGSFATWGPDGKAEPLQGWDPTEESLEQFKKRVSDHVRERQAWARAEGLVPAVCGPSSDDAYRWAARYLALQESADATVREWRRRGRRCTPQAVRSAVPPLLRQLGLSPRAALPRGRRRGSRNTQVRRT